jgi:protein-S-isoprenylcysteine O-methyltransferase Ste14
MVLVSLIVFGYFFLSGDGDKSIVNWFFMLLWFMHYLNRSFIFPLRTRTTGKQIPVAIVLMAAFFNVVNGWTNGHYLGSLYTYELTWIADPRFIVGSLLFFAGMAINIRSDNILLSLRKGGEKGYKIPYGGLFRYVSCPNHFGEILEWVGFAIMCWNLPALAFAVWTAANLIPRAISHHKWYKEKFNDYPEDRKAVIPKLV